MLLTTPALVADVQGWLNAPGTNFGWALVNAQENVATDFRAFFARDFSAAANPDGTLVPQLLIDYTAPAATVPEPGTLGLIGLGLAGLLNKRRRGAVSRHDAV
jgi:PEP-CTERM motif